MDDPLRQRFITAYKIDKRYNGIIQDLRSKSVKTNKESLNASKFRYPFYFYDSLLYSKGNNDKNQLIIFFDLVFEFLQNVYDDKYHFGRDYIL